MNIAQIEANLQKLVQSFSNESFIYDLLLAYGLPKASITRLQKGGMNLSKTEGEISWKKKLFYKAIDNEDVHRVITELKADEKLMKNDPRFIVVTDFETLLAIDRKTNDTLDINLLEIPKYFDFFLPLAGMEKAQHLSENPADVKAAERMAKLYDEIKKENTTDTPEAVHSLNVFLSRLLFCFFAEDTGIFEPDLFTNSIHSHTQPDGSDLSSYQYSNTICYNTFPFPPITVTQKQELEKHVYQILDEREKHSEKTLAQLYDPDKMPEGLREAHHQNDLAVERCYRSRPFETDEERLEYLFKLYEQMIEEEKTRGTLFEGETKSKKKRK